MGVIFDGNRFAQNQSQKLISVVVDFQKKHNRRPKLVSVYNPQSDAASKYTDIKARKAREMGVRFESVEYRGSSVEQDIEDWNLDETVDGIMVQTPLFGEQESGRVEENKLIQQIAPNKDVDGLRDDSPYVPAVVRAILEILNSNIEIRNKFQEPNTKIAVLGSRGFVGSKLIEQLHRLDVPTLWGMDSNTLDLEKLQQADVVVTATGVQGLFGPDMVKDGVCLIDVGYPKGDFDSSVAQKTSFYTPVPGGVGPVTVVSLFGNLLNL